MSQVQDTAQTLNTESAADEIYNLMTEAEQPEKTNETQEEETNEETQEVESSNDSETESEEESLEESTEDETEEETNESDEAEPEAEEESTDYQTVDDLAQALDMPLEDFMANIKGKVKINGQEQEVTLSDLKNGYQMESDYRQKTAAHAEKVRAFEQESTQQSEQIQSSLAQVNVLLTNAEQELVNEYNAVNWDELRDTDREEYLIKESEFNKRNQKLQTQKQQAYEETQRLAQEQEIKNQQAHQETLQREYTLMLDNNPEWQDEAVFKKDQAEIQTYLTSKGFNETEINQLVDHRIVGILRDALKAQADISKVEIAKKKVKKLPKVLKAGAKQTKADIKANSQSNASKRFNKTGSRDDLVDLLINRM